MNTAPSFAGKSCSAQIHQNALQSTFRILRRTHAVKSGKLAHFCSMKIAQDVREYAKEQNVDAEKVFAVGMAKKAAEFKATGSEIYHRNVPDGGHEHH